VSNEGRLGVVVLFRILHILALRLSPCGDNLTPLPDQGAVRLYNFTAATQTLMGEGTRGDNTVQSINQSLNIWGIFTANGTDQYVVQYYTVSAFAASLGVANNRGTAEIYTQIMLMKIG
jgi:hypothetical protein